MKNEPENVRWPTGYPAGARSASRAAAMTGASTAAMAAALAVTLVPAVACWVVAVSQINGMDMGVATRLGSFGFFIAAWVVMMAAMMLPGAAPVVIRRVQAGGGMRALPLFVGSYLAVWTPAGMVVYAVDRPHGAVAAGMTLIAAGAYELTPLKQHFRRRCRRSAGSGFGFGLCCAGSSTGLMAMLVALGVMSIHWMAVITLLVLAQKLLPAKPAVDVPLALAIAGLGILIILAPSSVSRAHAADVRPHPRRNNHAGTGALSMLRAIGGVGDRWRHRRALRRAINRSGLSTWAL